MRQVLKKLLLENRFKIATQLYLGIGFVVAITLMASMFSWQSFERIGKAQRYVNEKSIPGLVSAFGIARRSATLVDAAPRLVAVTNSEDLKIVSAAIKKERALFLEELSVLLEQQSGQDQARQSNFERIFERIQESGNALIANIEEVSETVSMRLESLDKTARIQIELSRIQPAIAQILIPKTDDQLYFIVTGYKELGDEPAPLEKYRSEKEILHYRTLSALQESANLGVTVLTNVLNVTSEPLLEPQRERFAAVSDSIERNRLALGNVRVLTQTDAAFRRLLYLGQNPEDNVFSLRSQEIRVAAEQRELLQRNRNLALELVSAVESVVEDTQTRAGEANQVSERAVTIGGITLLALSALSVLGAFLVAWLFVGRFLVARLEWLAERMRKMAKGDLKEEIHLAGQDEVADMASALEVFRLSSLEALRVDMAEKLAGELSSKNEELEHVLGDLRTAQSQIVMREKLAALGELTAGVAHEIKNPLNFIKNFSEASVELVEEFGEILDEAKEGLPEEQSGLLQEIGSDLKGNAERIRTHAERANRIVHDMLLMGRGGGDRQLTGINDLLDEHVRLAFHSARATDSDFQLHIVKELDPDLGEVEVIPQDLGRLFLNLVSNACHATDKKRRALREQREAAIAEAAKAEVEAEEEAEEGETEDAAEEKAPLGYHPTLTVTSKLFEERFDVTIEDNGCGISEENVAKIFNPFFTTKPADQGTGLGLALSSDIIRAHGGSIDVKSELGEFTRMVVSIPLTPPPQLEDASDDDNESSESDETSSAA